MKPLPSVLPVPKLLAGFLATILAVTGMASDEPHRVLILTPFSRDTEPFTAAVSSFRTTLAAELGEPLDVQEVPLDLALFTDPEGELPLVSLIEKRLATKPVDLVVPVGGAAVQFAHRHRGQLFPETPVLVLTAAPRLVPDGFLDRNATLITEPINLPGMVEDILRMQPDTRLIAVVFGSSPLEKLWAAECRSEFASFASQVHFLWLDGLTLEETLSRCGQLPRDSFILHGLFLEDAIGVPCEKNLALRRLRETANAPVFSYFASELGQGPVGGHLFQNGELGVQGARMAIRILQGEQAGNIEPRILEAAAPEYWRELRRWNIAESNLPANAIIRHRQPGFWQRYGWAVVAAALLGLLQAGLIVGLLVNRKRRIRAEAEATLIADISAKFVNLPASEVDREILDAERRICELLGFDVAGLWQWSQDPEPSLKLTHLHGEVKVQPPDDMKAEDFFPWFQEALAAGRVVAFSSLDNLPDEAARDRESFRYFGIYSCLTLPLSVGGEPPIGALGLNATRREHSWSEEQVERLKMIGLVFTNALARRRADQALRESELRLGLAADAAGAGLWVLDWDQQVFWINDRARAIFGYPPELVLDMARFEQSVHPQDLDRIREVIDHAVSTGDPLNVEYRIRHDTRGWRWIASNGRPLFKASSEPERLLGLSMDITERKEEEQRICADEARLAAGFDLAGLGYYEFHFAEDHCFIDERLGRICGMPAGRLQASPTLENWMKQVHPDDLPLVLAEDAKLHGGEADRVSLHHRYIHPVDGIRWLHHFSGVAERNDSGEIVRTYGVIRDITDQRHAEMEALDLRDTLAHTGRVSLMGQLASALAHELSQPLGAILRNAEAAEILLGEAVPDVEEMKAIVHDVLRDNRRAGEVINKLRSLLRKGELNLQPLRLPHLVGEVLELLRPDAVVRNVSLTADLPPDLPPILGDRIHLQQVLLNLLINAMDALGSIEERERRVEVHAVRSRQGEVEVRVCDNGPGIPEDQLGKLFEPFFTTKPSGMGMGLAVSRGLIEALGGKLWAEILPEGGTCFRFTLKTSA